MMNWVINEKGIPDFEATEAVGDSSVGDITEAGDAGGTTGRE